MSVLVALGRHVGLATLAGMMAGGIVGGLGGRIAMRVTGFVAGPGQAGLVTTNGNRVGEITLGGTIGVLLVGVMLGVLGGLIYAVLEPWTRRLRPWHGLAFGVFLFVAAGIAVLDPLNSDFRQFGSARLNVAMFGALFLLFGIAIAWIFDRLAATPTTDVARARLVAGLGWFTVILGSALVLLAVSGLGSSPDAVPTLVIAAGLLLAAIAYWRRLPPLVGYAGLTMPLLAGASRLASGIPTLIAGF